MVTSVPVGIAPIEAIIEEARQGRPFILADARDPEGEGGLVIPAQFATPAQINFMATHACGLICLALTEERAAELRLTPMTPMNRSGRRSAFTVSIEARDGVSTGISAHDRALTVAVATDPSKSDEDIVSPGHVFPLVARQGGVLVRAGRTEAAVDVARLAGLHPAGVTCEIMNEQGEMSRLPELLAFAQQHGLKVGTVSDLIALRRKSERLIEPIIEAAFETYLSPDFRIHVYRSTVDQGEHVALVRGVIDPEAETLVRVHQVDLTADLLGWTAARKDYVAQALKSLAAHPGGAVGVFVRDPNPASISDRVSGGRRDYHLQHGYRDFGIGAQILQHLGVRRMRLMTSSDAKLAALEGFGLEITSRVAIPTD